jgi:hypothetical protein
MDRDNKLIFVFAEIENKAKSPDVLAFSSFLLTIPMSNIYTMPVC